MLIKDEDTLAISEFEGETILVHKVINVRYGWQYREVVIMTGPNAGMIAECERYL